MDTTLFALFKQDRKKLKENTRKVAEINKETKHLKENIPNTISMLGEDAIETGHYYVQVLDYLRETAHCLTFIADPVFTYIDNNHPPLTKDQENDLEELAELVNSFISSVIQTIKNADFNNLESLFEDQQSLLENILKLKKRQLKRIKNRESNFLNLIEKGIFWIIWFKYMIS